MSEVKVNKISPRSGTDVTLGDASDTFTVPTGAGLTVTDEVKTNKISPATGVAFALGDSGDTFTIPSGATLDNLGTATGFASIAWQTIVTASTLTAVAGNGYWIDTTSNTCTITLPASASNGDQIIFVDYARNWGTNKIIIDSNGLNYQGEDDTYTVEYTTDGQSVNIVYSGATNGWIPLDDDASADEPSPPHTQKAIMAFGYAFHSATAVSNLVNSSGVVATDTSGVGTARGYVGGATYGNDKGIFAYGNDGVAANVLSMSNLVNNSGVMATDVTGVGTARSDPAATGYGTDKAIFAYGDVSSSWKNMSNLVTNVGVVGTDVTGVGTARSNLGAATYGGLGGGKAIFAFGWLSSSTAASNLVTNAGVIGSDVSGVGTARSGVKAASYGGDKAIFAFGYAGGQVNMSNLVSNAGVVATDTTGVGTARNSMGAAIYGADKAIFYNGGPSSVTNLVSNSGVVATDTTLVGTARYALAGAGFSLSA